VTARLDGHPQAPVVIHVADWLRTWEKGKNFTLHTRVSDRNFWWGGEIFRVGSKQNFLYDTHTCTVYLLLSNFIYQFLIVRHLKSAFLLIIKSVLKLYNPGLSMQVWRWGNLRGPLPLYETLAILREVHFLLKTSVNDSARP